MAEGTNQEYTQEEEHEAKLYADVIGKSVKVTLALKKSSTARESGDFELWAEIMKGELHDAVLDVLTATLLYAQVATPDTLIDMGLDLQEKREVGSASEAPGGTE